MAVVSAGDSRVRESDWEDADHFVAFVCHAGRVWEMDGNTPRRGPLDRGPASDDFLEVSHRRPKRHLIGTLGRRSTIGRPSDR